MNFLDILKKNDKEFEKTFIPEEVEVIDVENDVIDHFIKNVDDEYEKIYTEKIQDIKFDFKEYIDNEGYPFLNKTNFEDYTFYDFIKYNSVNFYDLEIEVENDNKDYLESLQKEDNENYEEYKELHDFD